MSPSSACPDHEELSLFRQGRLSEGAARRVEEHLRVCPACQTRAQADPADTPSAGPSAGEAGGASAVGVPPTVAEPGHSGLADPAFPFLAPPQEAGELGRLGPYRVLKVLGAGGMGVVFLAEDPHLKRRVALKAMLPNVAQSETGRQRFLREARAAAAVEHDHIVPVYQIGEDRGVPFIAMPLLHGETLEERARRDGPLPIAEVLRVGRELARGLAAAHERGLIHRDVKPGNVWLEAGAGRVKILDFGLVRAVREARPDVAGSPLESAGGAPSTVPGAPHDSGQALTQQGVVGTPAFMAPEQALGVSVDARCDLFSLGCVLYYLGTGRLPFQGPDVRSTLLAVASKDPAPPHELRPDLPASLSRLVLDLLAKGPAARPPSSRVVFDRLDEVERAVQKTEARARWRLRWRRLRPAAVAVVVLPLLGVALHLSLGYAWWTPSLPVSFAHAPVEGDCAACHAKFASLVSKRATDGKCQQCHLQPPLDLHRAAQPEGMTPGCGTCHTEHKGEQSDLGRVADQHCTGCHNELRDRPGGTGWATFSSFAEDHPEFRVLRRKEGDPGRLKFNHKYHMTEGIVLTPGGVPFRVGGLAPPYREKYRHGRRDDEPVRLECSSCHAPSGGRDVPVKPDRPDPVDSRTAWEASVRKYFEDRAAAGLPRRSGAYMVPVRYRDHCAGCHELTFDPRLRRTAEHGQQPDRVREEVTRIYNETNPRLWLVPRPSSFVPLPGKRPWESWPEEEDPASRKAGQVIRELMSSNWGCAKCHVAEDGSDLNVQTRRVARPDLPEVWLPHVRFNHAAHAERGIGCKECHPKAYPSGEGDLLRDWDSPRKGAERILIEGIDSCRECHSPAPSARAANRGLRARHDCTACHWYHDRKGGLRPRPR